MSSLPLLVFLLCVSVHKCNARFLSIIVKESTVGKQGHPLIEDVSKTETYKTPVQLGLGNSVLKDLRKQIQKAIVKNEREIYKNQDGEDTTKQEEHSENYFLKEASASKSATSGDINVSSPNDWLRLTKTEEMQSSQARSLLGTSPNDNDEAVYSKENGVVEDTEVMDYAQPHRKPPIHNEKP